MFDGGPCRAWLARRLTPGEAFGLSLTVGLVLITLGGWLFGEIADSVHERDDLAAQDAPVTAWLVARRVGWLTAIMRIATQLGAFWFTIPLVVAVGLLFPMRWGRWRTVGFAVAVVGGTGLLVNAIKLLMARPRPVLTEVVATATGYAFPSGHTAQAVAAYGVVAYVLTRRLSGRRLRAAVWAVEGAVAATVGFSRIYLGVHWLTDVVGGFLVAALWFGSVVTAVTAFGGARTAIGSGARDRGGGHAASSPTGA